MIAYSKRRKKRRVNLCSFINYKGKVPKVQGEAKQRNARHGARQGKARQGKARQGKARQGKARQGKTTQGKVCALNDAGHQGKTTQGNLVYA